MYTSGQDLASEMPPAGELTVSPPSRASAARVLGGCRGPRYGLSWQGRHKAHDDFAATLGPRALRSPKRASKTES